MPHAIKNYRPEIDGLRALSVIAVMLNHVGLGIPGGSTGVEVFFVISGFLITRLLLNDLEQGTFSLADFWARRICRIFPALAAMVVAVLVAGYFLLLPHDLEHLAKSTVSQSLLTSNVYFLLDDAHPEMPRHLKPLVHTWSLAVEEQFYVLLPLLMFACATLRRIHTAILLTGIGIGSFLFSNYYVAIDQSVAFFLMPSRAWELLAGSLVALVPGTFRLPKWVNEILATTGFLAILYTLFFWNPATPFPGTSAVLPVAGAAAIILANGFSSTIVGRILSVTPCQYVGKISYSLYLWHWPIQVYFCCAFGGISLPIKLIILVLSFLIAPLSYQFIERPFRSYTAPEFRKRVFASGIAMQFALLCVAVFLWQTHGFPARLSTAQRLIVEDLSNMGTQFNTTVEKLSVENIPRLGIHHDTQNLDFALIGDTQAVSFAKLFDDVAKQHNRAGVVIANQSEPFFPRSTAAARREKVFLELIQTRRIRHAFIALSWHQYIYDNKFGPYLSALLKKIERDGTTRVSLVTQIPWQPNVFFPAYSRYVFAAASFPNLVSLREMNPHHHESTISNEARFIKKLRTVSQVDFNLIETNASCFDSNGRGRALESGRALYTHCDRLSEIGAELLLGNLVESAFNRMAHEAPGRSDPSKTGPRLPPRLTIDTPVNTKTEQR